MNILHYRSTRGGDKKTFAEILSSGLAPDGGLYEPTRWPHHSRLRKFLARNPTFPQVVGAVVGLFAGRRVLPHLDFTAIAHKAFEPFRNRAVVPLREVSRDLWLLELFHGPTFSFKDIPLQFYGQLLEAMASERKQLLIMIGATSGDTGSAAIEALRHVRGVRLFMLHPKDRISALQRKQMTCLQAPHICNIAVEGSYDDCLRLVKEVAQSEEIRARGEISAVNSFNWIRIAVQSAVYLYAAGQTQRHAHGTGKNNAVRFALASGNFGNAYAGYVAKKLGANIEGLTLAVSHNDFLHTLFQHGEVASGEVVPSLAPSIDIMTPNNIERLLFRALGESARKWNKLREQTEASGTLSVPRSAMRSESVRLFRTQRFDDEQIIEAMVQAYDNVGEPLDPHSAIALKAAKDDKRDASKKRTRDAPCATIALATASAAKFPETLERAIGARPHIPPRLAELETKTETFETISPDAKTLENIVLARLRERLDSDTSAQEQTQGQAQTQAQESATATTAAATVAVATAVAATTAQEEPSAQRAETTSENLKEEFSKEEFSKEEFSKEEFSKEEDAKEEDTKEDLANVESEEKQNLASTPEPTSPASTFSDSAPLPPSTSSFPSDTPAMPAMAALTAEEDSLEKKIAKLKEQTAQLDESLEAPGTSSTFAADDSFATSPYPSSSLPSSPPPPLTPSPPLSTWEGKTEAQTLSETTETASDTTTMASDTTASATMETESSPPDASSSDSIVSLADAAEQGQASLQEKIAKLKEQSAQLDEAAETLHTTYDSNVSFPHPSSASPKIEDTSTDATSVEGESVEKNNEGNNEGNNERNNEESTKETSSFAGAENFFSLPPTQSADTTSLPTTTEAAGETTTPTPLSESSSVAPFAETATPSFTPSSPSPPPSPFSPSSEDDKG